MRSPPPSSSSARQLEELSDCARAPVLHAQRVLRPAEVPRPGASRVVALQDGVLQDGAQQLGVQPAGAQRLA